MLVRSLRGVLVVVALSACEHDDAVELYASGLGSGTPVDTTRPGELAEGADAFGFPIPRDLRVVARMDDAVYARGALGFEAATGYVRERVVPKRIHTGPSKTVFELATLRNDTKTLVQVEVVRRANGVELIVRDRRRPPAIEGISEAERVERVGLTRDGRVIEKRAE